MWPRRQETFTPPDASPPRCAQLMGLASRGCLVLVLGATAERRNLLFRSDLGLPWIRTLRSTPFVQVKQQNEFGPSAQRASRRPSPIPLRAHVVRVVSTPPFGAQQRNDVASGTFTKAGCSRSWGTGRTARQESRVLGLSTACRTDGHDLATPARFGQTD